MIRKNLITSRRDSLKPKRRRGALPIVTSCPYCRASMSQTTHQTHRPACEAEFNNAPAQPADLMHDPGSGYHEDLSFIQR